MPEPTTQRTLLTPKQVAEWLGVSVATLSDWRYKQTGPTFTTLGRMIRYEHDRIQEFIDAGRVSTAA
ncbi:MAG: helix-turn-helix domain-containing protein [Microbacterium sp.]